MTLRYLDPESTQTLLEGIAELRRAEGLDGDAALSVADDLLDRIDEHDAIHVLFGCPTTLAGEISAHLWTAFGTTTSLAEMHAVNRHRDHRTVLREIGHRRLLGRWATSLPVIVRTVTGAVRMTSRWPAADFRASLDVPLSTLRARHGIRLRRPDDTSGGGAGAALRHVRPAR